MKDNGPKACCAGATTLQIAVEAHAQYCGAEITQQTTDRQQLVPLVKAYAAVPGTPETIPQMRAIGHDQPAHPSLQGIQVLVTPDSNHNHLEHSASTAPRNEQPSA